MKKHVPLVLSIALMISATSCSAATTKTVQAVNAAPKKISGSVSREGENRAANTDIHENTETDPTQKDTRPTVQEKTYAHPDVIPAKGEKIDFTTLNKIDNTSYSWWISLNKHHTTPGIPSSAQKLIDKYNGVYIGDTSKKVIYLTFDEGYENGYTREILDTLKADDVKALFFVTGPYVKTQPELVKRMLAEGHQVGNHTINHLNLPSLSDTTLENELHGLEKSFLALTGEGMKYMRPPSGLYSGKVLDAAEQLGYKTVFWSFAYKDYDIHDQKGPDHAYNMVMANLHNGGVFLLHAVSKDNAEALDRIIKGIRAAGYEIKPFDL